MEVVLRALDLEGLDLGRKLRPEEMFGTGQVGQHLHNQRLNLLSQRLLLILIVDLEPGKHDCCSINFWIYCRMLLH